MLKLDELRNHLATFNMQKAAVEQQFHQIVGAINFCSHLIAALEKAVEPTPQPEPQGVPQDGGTDNQAA